MLRGLSHETSHRLRHGIHAKPISAVDERGAALGFLDKISEEMRLGVVELFDTPF